MYENVNEQNFPEEVKSELYRCRQARRVGKIILVFLAGVGMSTVMIVTSWLAITELLKWL